MYSELQDRAVRRSRGWALVALTLVAGGLGASAAWGDIQVHVMNCTSDEVEAQAFDSKDSVKAVAASTKKFSQSGESGSLHCAGEGKGYCQMVLAVLDKPIACSKADSGAIGGSVQFNLDSGKWAVVTGYQTEKNSKGDLVCKPVVQLNLDSASCN
ncbi:MAG TPA: hypothetical protein VFE33_16855 [Thermoanaerobaculia bacterium]|nr:hypothetical protein [Thermoanaerobaculia bacterium]